MYTGLNGIVKPTTLTDVPVFQLSAFGTEKEEFRADMQQYEDALCDQDKQVPKPDAELTEQDRVTLSNKHGIWWRGLLHDPIPQNVQRIPINGQVAMFHKLLRDIPTPWLSFTAIASRANKKDISKWLDDMEKTTDGYYLCSKCGFGFRRMTTCMFHMLLCGKSGWTFCPLCKVDLQTESMYWFDRHLERHVRHAAQAFAQCGQSEMKLPFSLNEVVQMLVNMATVINKIRHTQKKTDSKPEVEVSSNSRQGDQQINGRM